MSKVKFTVTINGVWIAILLSITAISIYSVFSKDGKEISDFTVKTFGVAAGIVSALYVGDNINNAAAARREEEELRKTDRALKYISKWNDPSFYMVRDVVSSITPIIKQEDDANKHSRLVYDHVCENYSLDQKVNDILNFLEEISIAVNKDLVNQDLIKEFFSFIFERYAFVFAYYINEKRRLRNNTSMYKNFTELNDKWN